MKERININVEVEKFYKFAHSCSFLAIANLLQYLGNPDKYTEGAREMVSKFQKEFNRELTIDDLVFFVAITCETSEDEEDEEAVA